MQAQILFVAPLSELADLAATVINEKFPDKKNLFHVVRADLQEAEALVKKAADDGIEVIVSRGGTASFIENRVDLPMVYIQVTITDILQALLNAGEYPENIAIAGFGNMIYGCDELGKILHINFTEVLLNDSDDAQPKIAEAVAAGVEFVVGDAISVKMAAKYGIKSAFIQSGKESIYRALQTAVLIASIRREEQRKTEQLRAVVDESHDGIIAADQNGLVTILNPVAEKIFNISHFDGKGKVFEKIFPELSEFCSGEKDNLIKIREKQYAVRKAIISVRGSDQGYIYNLQNISEVQKLERSIRKKLSAKGLVAKYNIDDIIGQSKACLNMKRKAAKYALTQSTILITGESGTGKEMLVQSIHNLSVRAKGPFVAVNCAALPENLLESELFGYAEGAFTGARRGGRQGMFELAHGGTLFLDEIGEMQLPLQSRLLRVLQEREVMPLGGEVVIPIDVRIIAATNKNLAAMIADGNFRSDLYYRLNILRIHMPSLKDRKEDIDLLARQFLVSMRDKNPQITDITRDAVVYLEKCEWPGNIRQFGNMMERILLLTTGSTITISDVRDACEDDSRMGEESIENREACKNLMELEDELLQKTLREEGFNYTKTAKRLGIHRTTLWRRLKKYDMQH
ncbi:sigma-54-dependent Fis family transcriptional regulator [Pectinatus haikarae]|uniref:Transcriptional regulator with PAS, ATPase and Fis domain n=1 Tax=Pectinatus haikarae TaxID=349096 RepID=A0ABT9YB72_9FIRM|nr:sigma-54-dependent Fis family transcriptional regulator [Pectinatus haikarae]MDQ0204971.1 transcriptional regulator with PAS, ATPase and Fis domain [Pectinatus haikarae]